MVQARSPILPFTRGTGPGPHQNEREDRTRQDQEPPDPSRCDLSAGQDLWSSEISHSPTARDGAETDEKTQTHDGCCAV